MKPSPLLSTPSQVAVPAACPSGCWQEGCSWSTRPSQSLSLPSKQVASVGLKQSWSWVHGVMPSLHLWFARQTPPPSGAQCFRERLTTQSAFVVQATACARLHELDTQVPPLRLLVPQTRWFWPLQVNRPLFW